MAKWMSVAQVKEKIKESSAEEVTAQYLETIGKSKVNGYITVSEKALEQAKKIDNEGHNGPLAGVPIAIKDNISVVGLPNSCGSKILEDYIPPFNAHVRNIVELVNLFAEGKISDRAAVEVIRTMLDTKEKKTPSQIIEEKSLFKAEDDLVTKAIAETIAENEAAVQDYLGGTEKSLNFLVGQVMHQD